MTKNKNKNSGDSGELDSLINACVDNQLSEEEATRLSRLIEESPEARERYWELASVHGMVEQSMQNASLNAATGVEPVALIKTNRLSYWRRLKGITAGMAIGVFSASLVWAYAIPRPNQPQPEKREIAFESFEDSAMKMSGRFPAVPNQWHGRILSVEGIEGMPVIEGTRVGKFIKGPEPKYTYTRYLVDMKEHPLISEGQTRSVEVNASFYSANPEVSSVFQIRLAAFSQEPEKVRPIWNDQETLFNTVLQHVGRNYQTEPGEKPGWHKLRATIEIPPGTRSVVVSLGAGNTDPDTSPSEHYVDAVQVHLVDRAGPLG